MIEINQLQVVKNGRTICSVPQLTITPGERVAIEGLNGSGKTTLLRVLSGLEKGYNGRCTVNATWNERGYVDQNPYLFRGTVLFNVTYGLRGRSVTRAERERLGMHWLDRLGMHKLASHPATHLSGGERRRVALARTMILRPRLILLDEPLADMDEDGAAAVVAALHEVEGSTIVVASPTTLPNGLTSRRYLLESVALKSG